MEEYRYTKTEIGIFPTTYIWQPLKGGTPKSVVYEAEETKDETSSQLLFTFN